MKLTNEQKRQKRHRRVRAKVAGTSRRPRLAVSRSTTNIYAQLIDDHSGVTLAASSSLKMKEKGLDAAKKVGAELAKAAKAKKVATCVFDRSGYLYHGRVKALAEGAREGGLTF